MEVLDFGDIFQGAERPTLNENCINAFTNLMTHNSMKIDLVLQQMEHMCRNATKGTLRWEKLSFALVLHIMFWGIFRLSFWSKNGALVQFLTELL